MFAICDKIILKNNLKPHRKLFGNYTFSAYDDINSVPKTDWSDGVKDQNEFLSYSYLSIIHLQQSDSFRFRYVIVYYSKKPIGVIYFQINDFSASLLGELVSHQIEDLQHRHASIFKKYIEKKEHETIMRLVTCGNNFISGEHGFCINVASKKIKFKLVEGVIDAISREEKLRGKISAILVKDFYEEGFGDKNCWYCTRFIHFNVEPNMIVELPTGLNHLNDYIQLFSKKYRNRAKSILKASSTLIKKRLSREDIIKYDAELYNLYSQVFNHAKFKLVQLPENYFSEMIKNQHTTFYIDAWFLDHTLVSFASGFSQQNCVEAHFIGFNYELNKQYELYQTILYHYIEEAILNQRTRINLGRTASEIKSTVGAKAHDLICYIKPQNTVSKLIMKPFMQFLQPSEWVPRNPFKEE